MKTILIGAGMLLATAFGAASADEAAPTPAADKQYEPLISGSERRSSLDDDSEWRDSEAADEGTTLLELQDAQKKLRPERKLPTQTIPGIESAADQGQAGATQDESVKGGAEKPGVELSKQGETVTEALKETRVPKQRSVPLQKR